MFQPALWPAYSDLCALKEKMPSSCSSRLMRAAMEPAARPASRRFCRPNIARLLLYPAHVFRHPAQRGFYNFHGNTRKTHGLTRSRYPLCLHVFPQLFRFGPLSCRTSGRASHKMITYYILFYISTKIHHYWTIVQVLACSAGGQVAFLGAGFQRGHGVVLQSCLACRRESTS